MTHEISNTIPSLGKSLLVSQFVLDGPGHVPPRFPFNLIYSLVSDHAYRDHATEHRSITKHYFSDVIQSTSHTYSATVAWKGCVHALGGCLVHFRPNDLLPL